MTILSIETPRAGHTMAASLPFVRNGIDPFILRSEPNGKLRKA
jgi:hypothetical protein